MAGAVTFILFVLIVCNGCRVRPPEQSRIDLSCEENGKCKTGCGGNSIEAGTDRWREPTAAPYQIEDGLKVEELEQRRRLGLPLPGDDNSEKRIEHRVLIHDDAA